MTVIVSDKKAIPTLSTITEPRSKKWYWFGYTETLVNSSFEIPNTINQIATAEDQNITVDGRDYQHAYGIFIDFDNTRKGSYKITHMAEYADGEVEYTSINVPVGVI